MSLGYGLKRPWKGQMFIATIFDLHVDPSGVVCFPKKCNPTGVGVAWYFGCYKH